MPPGNMGKGGDHDGNCESVCQCDRENSDAAGAPEVKIDADGPRAKEDQREGAKKLGDELLSEVVHRMASGVMPCTTRRREILAGKLGASLERSVVGRLKQMSPHPSLRSGPLRHRRAGRRPALTQTNKGCPGEELTLSARP